MNTCHHYDCYVGPHPRVEGYFVYCADCDECTEAHPTKEEAIKNWNDGKRIVAYFDRGEIVNCDPLVENLRLW
jgi:epoxyqueuosine reductase QueG